MAVKRYLKRLAQGVTAPFAPLMWRARPAPRLLVLMYHRVLPANHPDRPHEQPGMFVSPQTLDMHLGILRRHFEIVHLEDWAREVANARPVPRMACALTFDDGWRDNFEYAFPILRAHDVPATVYLLPDLVGTRYSFWPNRLARLLGDRRNNERRAGWPEWLQRELAEVAASALPLSMAQIDRLIDHCKSRYTDSELLNLLADVSAATGTGAGRDLMSWDEIRQMAASGKIRFGSHTRRHTRLDTRAPAELLEDEIRGSRGLIEQQLQATVSSFCYPNGDHCPAALELVRSVYATAVTTRRGWNSVSSDAHLLSRVGMHEDVSSTGPAFLARLSLAA
jgi:peptidoglycan/xylan/chitin deacetylase (PgdA/CDA1 family)